MKHNFSQKPKYEIGQKVWFTDKSLSENTGLEFENKVEAVIISVHAIFAVTGGGASGGPKQITEEETYAYGYMPVLDDDSRMNPIVTVTETDVVLRDS